MSIFKNTKPKETEKRTETLKGARPIVGNDSPFAVREAYKTARTNIMFALGDRSGCKKVVVTSAMPGEGKTTTCINIASTFAQQTGTRVLLVDGDMRRPRVHRSLGIENEDGLANLLASFCDYKTFRPHKTKYGFDCITAGSIPPNPSELLSSPKAAEIFEYFGQFYDYIFLDTPPVTIVSDAIISMAFADGVVLVARQKYSSYDVVRKAVTALEYADVKVLGFILNDVEIANYKYGNKYASRYYSEQDSGSYMDGAAEDIYADFLKKADKAEKK